MSKGIKANVTLEFYRWRLPETVPPLELQGSDGEMSTGLQLSGTIAFDKDELYDILRAARVEGKEPLFLLKIID